MSFATVGFFYGYVGSAQPGPAPTTGDAYAFPGSITQALDDISSIGRGSVVPQGGNYSAKILTIGPTYGKPWQGWGDGLYTELASKLTAIKAAGWTGVCYDWEVVSSDHTTGGFNALLQATTDAELACAVTTTAEGPYEWRTDKDATGIDWSLLTSFGPQLCGGNGASYTDAELDQYTSFWLNGGGTSAISGVKFVAPPKDKLVWACVPETVQYLEAHAPETAGYTIWCFDPQNNG